MGNKKPTKKQIKVMHLGWFKKQFILNGAPKDITDRQVSRSAGFKQSEESYLIGWQTGIEIQREFFE